MLAKQRLNCNRSHQYSALTIFTHSISGYKHFKRQMKHITRDRSHATRATCGLVLVPGS
jgi:hypothetical protein